MTHFRSSLITALLAAAAGLAAHGVAHARSAAAAGPAVVDDLRTFAQDRPRACPPASLDVPQPPAGWIAEPARCVWRGLLRVHRWHAPARPATACTGLAAHYWAWMRTRFGQPMRAQSHAWDMQWTSNAVRVTSPDEGRIAVIVRNPDSSWTASEWHWTGSPRKATRAWQQSRWRMLELAAAALQPAPPVAAPGETVMLRTAWEDALRGRAAETKGQLWRWQAGSTCLAIDAVGLSDAQVPMPYQANESRLEQRAAMQLLMARRHPGAQWLVPFSLLAPAPERGRARYLTVWRIGDQVRGQLWIPRSDDGAIVRVGMVAGVAPAAASAARPPSVFHAVRAISAEMTAVVAAWDARHER